MDAYRFTIDVPVRSRWSDIDRVRGSVQECLRAVFNEMGPVDALAMTTGELLENAVKYGDWGAGDGVFRLSISGTRSAATVVVANPVADQAHVDEVRAALDFLATHDDAGAAYRARLVDVARGPRGAGGGLGLLRVAYEGGARLSVAHEGRNLSVCAVLSFDEAGA